MTLLNLERPKLILVLFWTQQSSDRKDFEKYIHIPLRWLKVANLKLLLPLPLLQSAIMEIHAILKAQADAAADSSNLSINRLAEAAGL